MINPVYYSEYSYTSNSNSNNKSIKLTDLNNENNYLKPKKELFTDGIICPETCKDNINTVTVNEVNNDINACKDIMMKQNILNPLTVIIKLSILSCKPVGTKIHVQDNIIYFQEPGIFQSLARYIFKSNKSHLQYIYNPIKIACHKYLTKEFIKTTPSIINIFISAKNGIENLIKTYSKCSITILCLKYYHVIISSYINQTSNEYLFTEYILNENEIQSKNLYTKELLDKFDNQWNASKLKIVLDLMDFLLNHDSNENKTNNIKSLETIININDEETQKIIANYNTE
jgi:hypothetical protein